MTSPPPFVDLLIVGAGLSGLAAAAAAQRAGLDWRALEARDRVGGRALSQPGPEGRAVHDLGPAWIWPHDRRAQTLARRLGLGLFDQHAEGRLVFEDRDGAIRRDLDMAPMAGALRVDGGLGGLAEAASRDLPAERIALGAPVAGLRLAADRVRATTRDGRPLVEARRAIVALPPRLAARLDWRPALPDATLAALQGAPGWMAAQAKLVAIYDAPFWREAGLSGDAISHRGPLAEVHDASPADAAEGALFGFVGLPPAARAADAAGQKNAPKNPHLTPLGPPAGRPAKEPFNDRAQ
ncbi:MAG: FAD-dependent oxidoreductase, partial [Pseudomonadota bacterium]